jgi:hypothetical protein
MRGEALVLDVLRYRICFPEVFRKLLNVLAGKAQASPRQERRPCPAIAELRRRQVFILAHAQWLRFPDRTIPALDDGRASGVGLCGPGGWPLLLAGCPTTAHSG